MKQLQELRNEILTLRNYGVINKEEEKSLLTKLNSVKEQFAICGVGNSNDKKGSEFEEWLKKQKLTEVITKEYKCREFVLDEEFVLAKYNQDKQS